MLSRMSFSSRYQSEQNREKHCERVGNGIAEIGRASIDLNTACDYCESVPALLGETNKERFWQMAGDRAKQAG